MRTRTGGLADAALDLALGSRCAVCDRPGRALCDRCGADLPRVGRPCWPTPTPAGLVLPMAGGQYAGALKALVNAHKEERRLALATPLGEVVAAVVLDLRSALGDRATGRLRLVPVPSSSAVVRRRGHDPLLRTTRVAAAVVRRAGVDAVVDRALRQVARPADQTGLDAESRARNLAGTMVAARGVRGGGVVVLVDDVVTTGSTVREAQRALEAAGVEVAGIAAVAATRRWSAGPPGAVVAREKGLDETGAGRGG